MKINKYFLMAVLVFFLNSAGLPYGLLYTTILTPLVYIWVVRRTGSEPLLPFLFCLSPFLIAHMIVGVDLPAYGVSLFNILCLYIFCCAFYLFLRSGADIEIIFTRLLLINFVLCLIAIPVYFSTFSGLFWIEQFLTQGISHFKRLRMFTYEASYYSTLMVPLIFFFVSQIMLKRNKIPVMQLLLLLALPIFMSFSLGVISAIVFSLMVTSTLYYKQLIRKKRVFEFVFAGTSVLVLAVLVLVFFFPDNTLFVRFNNILTGNDSSARGRTFEAFMLADRINALKSSWFGIGFGQVKIIGADIIRNYYNYPMNYVISIPNASAETIAMLGWVGFGLRMAVEIALFFYTRVWKNYYRLFLFFFIFLYQFTGSFITNVAEYMIWILAFTRGFHQFDVFKPKDIHDT